MTWNSSCKNSPSLSNQASTVIKKQFAWVFQKLHLPGESLAMVMTLQDDNKAVHHDGGVHLGGRVIHSIFNLLLVGFCFFVVFAKCDIFAEFQEPQSNTVRRGPQGQVCSLLSSQLLHSTLAWEAPTGI